MILDDATSEIYYAQLVEAECTRTVMAALREVIETQGLFCSLYSDRAGHFFVTPKRGERVDTSRPTQVGRALQELGVKMIPAYSPQARGRIGAELRDLARAAAAGTAAARDHGSGAANEFLRTEYIAEFNQQVRGAGSAEGERVCAAPAQGSGLDLQRAA